MKEIFEAIKISAIKIDKTIKIGDTQKSENQNTSGDTQLKLDVASDVIIEDEFKKLNSIKEIMSEEKDDAVTICEDGEYLVAYDPLDGSSLVDVNLSVGSIFGIYKNSFSGKNLVASVYVVYGPRVELVIADEKISFYRLDGEEFKYIDDLSLNEKGKINAPGGTQQNWLPHHKSLIDSIFADGYRLRYSGGMVPDLHQVLLKKGGLFSYPATSDTPKGKLRMNFEVFPFALVYELAGGEAIDDKGNRLLDLEPSKLHDTTPCFFGSKSEIARVKEAYGV
jgi:fructose-1,6-bisphosphatase I